LFPHLFAASFFFFSSFRLRSFSFSSFVFFFSSSFFAFAAALFFSSSSFYRSGRPQSAAPMVTHGGGNGDICKGARKIGAWNDKSSLFEPKQSTEGYFGAS
jgi:hypothetical protein